MFCISLVGLCNCFLNRRGTNLSLVSGFKWKSHRFECGKTFALLFVCLLAPIIAHSNLNWIIYNSAPRENDTQKNVYARRNCWPFPASTISDKCCAPVVLAFCCSPTISAWKANNLLSESFTDAESINFRFLSFIYTKCFSWNFHIAFDVFVNDVNCTWELSDA